MGAPRRQSWLAAALPSARDGDDGEHGDCCVCRDSTQIVFELPLA